jgi:hypothetical protein
LEHEFFPDFAASITATYRRYDNYDIGMTYYPAAKGFEGVIDPAITNGVDENGDPIPAGLDLTNLIIDPRHPPANGPWYVQAGTIPATSIVGGTFAQDVGGNWVNTGGTSFSWEGAAGRPYYLPASYYPVTGTDFGVTRKSNAWNTYMGLDFVVTKRLSNRWFMNGSFTFQNQKAYWGTDYFDPTNKWALNGEPYAMAMGGASGKINVNMYTRWMAKLSGLYQLPYGFDISGTMNAREGWKVPHYNWIYTRESPNPAYHWSAQIWTEPIQFDAVPTFINFSLRVEKRINIATGRMYLMADIFNLFNSHMLNRAYDAYSGDVYLRLANGSMQQYSSYFNTTNRAWNEILNPRIWRFGVRFEF